MKNLTKRVAQLSAKELYKRCKPHMMQRFGRILSHEISCVILYFADKLDRFCRKR